ncbi:UNVERIFIED_CONTAM: hypothetical protein Slati_4226000 [Sesamum latifolium]|uniref:Integrase catalytic domain-containing protein n=1 Tax=Sesamum latifolium TaxID=2727402 RepID=A0AAW2TAN6_9LAMI
MKSIGWTRQLVGRKLSSPRGSEVASHEFAGCELTRSLETRSLASRSQVASSPGRWLASNLRELEVADWSFGKESLTSKVFFWKRECPQLLSNPGMFVVEVNMISNSASWVLNTDCGAHICNNLQVLKRSRKLSKDEMVLRLDDEKAVAAEAVGSISLVISNRVRIELKDCFYVPNVCGPLNTPARGGFSYFITFTDDHSWYGYVYLMRHKSKAFGRFKEYRLKVENLTSRKIKALRSDRGGGYLSGEFIDYLKENGILSQWNPPGKPQLNGVAERRNRSLLDIVRSMMSFTELSPSFWGYALETAAKLLNIAP